MDLGHNCQANILHEAIYQVKIYNYSLATCKYFSGWRSLFAVLTLAPFLSLAEANSLVDARFIGNLTGLIRSNRNIFIFKSRRCRRLACKYLQVDGFRA